MKNLLLVLLITLSGCRLSENNAEKLSKNDPVYVLIEDSSLASLNSKLTPSLANYGEVSAQDFKPNFKYSSVMQNFSEDLGLTVYTNERHIPAGSMYLVMHPKDLFKIILDGSAKVNNISVNPSSSLDTNYEVFKPEIEATNSKLPDLPAIPLTIKLSK